MDMDLPKKRSNWYLAGIYAFFIVLLAFTLSLFYTSRRQKFPPQAKPDTTVLEPQDSSDNLQKIAKKIKAENGR